MFILNIILYFLFNYIANKKNYNILNINFSILQLIAPFIKDIISSSNPLSTKISSSIALNGKITHSKRSTKRF